MGVPIELTEILSQVADKAMKDLLTDAFVRGMSVGREQGETAAYQQYCWEQDMQRERTKA